MARRIAGLIGILVLLAACIVSARLFIRKEKTDFGKTPPAPQAKAARPAPVPAEPPAEHSIEKDKLYTLQKNGVNRHPLEIESDQAVRVGIEQKGVDVEVALSGPDGDLFTVDSPGKDDGGRENIFFVTKSAGTYTLNVKGPEGDYLIQEIEIRRANALDRLNAQAEAIFHRARAIRKDDPAEAVKGFLDAARLWGETGNRERQANAFDRIGVLFVENTAVQSWEKSLAYLGKARSLYRSIKDPVGEARMLILEGVALKELNRAGEAEAAYGKALEIAEKNKLAEQAADALLKRGILRRNRGDSLRALADFEASVVEWGKANDRPEELADALDNVLYLQARLGMEERALELAGEVIPRLRLPDGKGKLLTRLAQIQRSLGNLEDARGHAEMARKYRQQGGNVRGIAATLVELGLIYRQERNFSEARKAGEEALLLYRSAKNPTGEATILANLGMLLYDEKDYPQALAYLERALEICGQRELPGVKAVALYTLALVEYDRGNFQKSRMWAFEALEILDGDELEPAEELEEPYELAKQGVFGLLIDLLLFHPAGSTSEQDLRLAFEISERSQRRRMLDGIGSLRSRLEALQKGSPALLDRRKVLEREIRELEADEQRRQGEGRPTAPLEADLKKVLDELRTIDARIQLEYPWYPLAKRPWPVGWDEALEMLDDETILLVYKVMRKRSVVFVLTKSRQDVFELPPTHELEEEIGNFWCYVSKPSRRDRPWRDHAGKLAGLLLGPVADRLDSFSRLVVVPDGPIHDVPFSALTHPKTGDLLVERHEIVGAPSVSIQKAIRGAMASREPPPGPLAVFALSEFKGRYPALEDSEKEATEISAFFREEKIPPFRAIGRLEATRAAAKSGVLRRHRVLHFATHARSHPRHPELSGIALEDGDLTAREIQDMDLRADLVVLSACETAQGAEVEGEGPVGLAHTFLYAGASRVVASLWKVDDAATRAFMKRFYQEMDEEMGSGRTPADALRATQDWMSKTERWADPYYWAGFQLIGDWQ